MLEVAKGFALQGFDLCPDDLADYVQTSSPT
jgi:hypothetical protein